MVRGQFQPSHRRSAGPLSSGVPRGAGEGRGARLLGRWAYIAVGVDLIACVSRRWQISERHLGIRYSGGGGASVSSELESRRSELLVFLSSDTDDGFSAGGSREVGFLNFTGHGSVSTPGVGWFFRVASVTGNSGTFFRSSSSWATVADLRFLFLTCDGDSRCSFSDLHLSCRVCGVMSVVALSRFGASLQCGRRSSSEAGDRRWRSGVLVVCFVISSLSRGVPVKWMCTVLVGAI
jgi:hypothetical protein